MKQFILFVEDDPDMRLTTRVLLTRAGYRVLDVDSAEEALTVVFKETPDLVVVDIRLPGISGFKFCEILRSDPRTRALPILLLTSLTKTQDKVEGLKTGGDDYITKPFEPAEFLARVEALLRRASSTPVTSVLIQWRGISVDLESRRAEVDGVPIPLRRKELDLLVTLLKNSGKVVPYERLFRSVNDDESPVPGTAVDTSINTLRERLGPYGPFIQARGMEGYFLGEGTP
ncbi:MAG: response regulator transcription factor [Elusimicrobia bacterium]|nr:response regulator transcription factor [Elusimicrobiota bacterium]